jgi:ANTAR domain-containing protein
VTEDRIDPRDQNCEADLLEQAPPRPVGDIEHGSLVALASPTSAANIRGRRHPLIAEIERLRSELAVARTTIANLQAALTSSRDIGPAIGILMCQHGVGAEQAFDLLRAASQNTHRKLRQIAADVVYTGSLDGEPRK